MFKVVYLERINAHPYEDRETVVVELKKILHNSLYTLIAAHNSCCFPNFSEFLNSFSLSQIKGFLVCLCVRIAPLYAFYNEIELLTKQSKKIGI